MKRLVAILCLAATVASASESLAAGPAERPSLYAANEVRTRRAPTSVDEDTAAAEKYHRRRRADKNIVVEEAADVNFCIGYSGIKTLNNLSSFISLMVQIDLVSNTTFDLQGLYALTGENSTYFYAGGGFSWYSAPAFRDFFVSGNGGVYLGGPLAETLPAGRLLLGWRFREPGWIGTMGFSGGPEVIMASTGTALGGVFRLDMGFTW